MTQIPAWDDVQIRRFNFRNGLFARRGLTAALAEWWADRLAVRDYERDDRRICLECESLQRSGHCFAAANGRMRGVSTRLEPVTTILQRCSFFSWQKP